MFGSSRLSVKNILEAAGSGEGKPLVGGKLGP
jgi:hypothetical protein